MMSDDLTPITSRVKNDVHEFELFSEGISSFFLKHPELISGSLPFVHSVRRRIKSMTHVEEKIRRKIAEGRLIDADNIFHEITDIAGVRVLHLHQQQLGKIHEVIMKKVDKQDWSLHEPPKAYTWDPESVTYMRQLNIEVKQKESCYTSVHYVIKPRPETYISCEVQVRTLFEEIWGEIDHSMNYPKPTGSRACREQLLVLAKLIGAGSRLVDSVFRTLDDHQDL